MTREEGIREVFGGPSHVVILGAGASIASDLDNPEPSGKKLPSMDNLIDLVGLADIVTAAVPGGEHENFEALYSRIYTENPHSPVLAEVEKRIYSFFSSLTLPPTPTIYDYLLLALRPKDLIATFNWDPFLYQAFSRNRKIADMPQLAFLHGSVSVAYSSETGEGVPAIWASEAASGKYLPTRLMYPVTKKDYNKDKFIAGEWHRLKGWMERAQRVTIFGYGAPDTDVEAMELISAAWGDSSTRRQEQIELIDIQNPDVLRQRWGKLIFEGHDDICSDYFGSILALFPRRTGESFIQQFQPSTEAEAFQENNPVPNRFDTLTEMWQWHRPLIEAEQRLEAENT